MNSLQARGCLITRVKLFGGAFYSLLEVCQPLRRSAPQKHTRFCGYTSLGLFQPEEAGLEGHSPSLLRGPRLRGGVVHCRGGHFLALYLWRGGKVSCTGALLCCMPFLHTGGGEARRGLPRRGGRRRGCMVPGNTVECGERPDQLCFGVIRLLPQGGRIGEDSGPSKAAGFDMYRG